MAFDSLSEIWTMAGHGPYVWTCYGVFLLAMLLLASVSVKSHRQQLRDLGHDQQRASTSEQSSNAGESFAGSFGRVKTPTDSNTPETLKTPKKDA